MPHENQTTIAFALSEVARLSAVPRSRETYANMDIREVLATLPDPYGRGSLPCGSEALNRLYLLSERACQKSSYCGRIGPSEVFEYLKKIISERFLGEGKPVDQKHADRAVSAAIKQAALRMSTKKYFIPCHIGNKTSPTKFKIDEVEFHCLKSFFKKIEKEIDEFNHPEKDDFKQSLLDDAIKYYQSFDWIAEISIENCSENTSRMLAERYVQLALDSIHVGLRSYNSKYIRMFGPNIFVDRGSQIIQKEDGKIDVSGYVSWKTNTLPDNWWSSVSSNHMKDFYDLVGIAITEAIHSHSSSRPLAGRLVDALSWYGEATRDNNYASQTVKYVTAMERLLITSSKEGLEVSSIFRNRGAALVSFLSNEPYSDLHENFKKVYDVRSSIVHGSESPTKSFYNIKGLQPDELAARVIIAFTFFCKEEGLKAENVSDKIIEKSFDDLEALAKSGTKANQPQL